jgi:hypothetical protein
LSPHPLRSLLIATAALALALSGCGGGGDESSSGAQSPSHAAANAPKATTNATAQAKGESKEKHAFTEDTKGTEGPQQGQPSKPRPHHVAVTLPPISSAAVEGSKAPAPGVKVAKGGDNSVQGYGVESSDAAREEAALALQAYLDARLEEDWGRACSYVFEGLKEQLEQASIPNQGQVKQPSGCAGAMAGLSKGVPGQALREGAQITRVLSFRTGGDVPSDPSFLLYQGLPDKTLYSMPMYLEGGGWKVGLVLPSALPL